MQAGATTLMPEKSLLLSSFLFTLHSPSTLVQNTEQFISSCPQNPRPEWSPVDGDAMVLRSSRISYNIASCGTLSVQAALVQNYLLC